MRVVLSGYYGFHNVGDEAILQAIIGALRAENSDIDITVLSNDPEYTKKTYGVMAVNRWKLGEVFRAISAADGVISGGGSLLQDKTGLKSVPYYTGVMMIAYFLRKPFFVYAQGIGPLDQSMSQVLVKYALSKADYLSVRDQDSLDLLREIGISGNIELVPDPVLGMEYRPGLNQAWLEQQGLAEGERIITVALRDWNSPQFEGFKTKVIEVLDRCVQEGHRVVFLPMHGEHDEDFARKMVEAMQNGEKVAIFPHDASIEEKISFIGASALLLGMRLHALIFAAIAQTPMIGVSYDPKIDSFMKQIGQPLLGHVDGDWTSQQVTKLIDKQLKEQEKQITNIKAKAVPLQKKANATAKKIIELLSGDSH